MGLLGVAARRMLYGASQLANQYITEDLAQQRAQALADIQFNLAKRTEEYTQSDEVQRRRRGNEESALRMRSGVELEAERNKATDSVLQDAKAKNAGSVAKAESAGRAQGESDVFMQLAKDPLYFSAQRRLALAKHVDSADNVARAELARMEIADRKTLTEKYDQVAAIELDDTLTPDQKAAKAKPLMVVIQAIKSKNAPGGKEDKEPKSTRETKTEFGPDGNPIAKTVTDKGPIPASEVSNEDQVRGRLAQARKDGRISDAVADLRSRGATPQQLKALGVTDQDMAATKPVPETVNDNTLSVGDDYRSPEFKSRLQARIVEAQRGGRPLTRIERVRATQLGLSE